jgi:cell division protein FtsN
MTAPEAVTPGGDPAASLPEQKSKSFFNFGLGGKTKLTGKAAETAAARGTGSNGNWSMSPDPSKVSEDPNGEPPTQVAAITPETVAPPAPAPAPEPQPAPPQASSGYVAQLASFRSEAEAMAEYDRLRAKHGTVLSGLSPRIVKANIAGGTRYRLGVGPLDSRSAALKICNSLIAAGERDCLVRSN